MPFHKYLDLLLLNLVYFVLENKISVAMGTMNDRELDRGFV